VIPEASFSFNTNGRISTVEGQQLVTQTRQERLGIHLAGSVQKTSVAFERKGCTATFAGLDTV